MTVVRVYSSIQAGNAGVSHDNTQLKPAMIELVNDVTLDRVRRLAASEMQVIWQASDMEGGEWKALWLLASVTMYVRLSSATDLGKENGGAILKLLPELPLILGSNDTKRDTIPSVGGNWTQWSGDTFTLIQAFAPDEAGTIRVLAAN